VRGSRRILECSGMFRVCVHGWLSGISDWGVWSGVRERRGLHQSTGKESTGMTALATRIRSRGCAVRWMARIVERYVFAKLASQHACILTLNREGKVSVIRDIRGKVSICLTPRGLKKGSETCIAFAQFFRQHTSFSIPISLFQHA
jgi:hypothetical protein